MNCKLCKINKISHFYLVDQKKYYKCSHCHIVFLDSKHHPDRSEERRIYDQHENSPMNQGYVDFLKKLAIPLSKKLTPGTSGLDYGCGPGPTLDGIFANMGFKVDRYDPIYFKNQKILQKKHDFITCTEVAEHFFDPRKEFQFLKSILKKNGYLGIMTQMLENGKIFNDWWYRKDPTHVTFYQPQTFEWIANWLNLSIEFPDQGVIIMKKSLSPN